MPLDYDAELTRYGAVLRRTWGIRPHDNVLDIGCGAGETTRAAADVASAGHVLGVDVSADAVARAREAGGAAYECADAQTYAFAPASFDVAISRFGTMFFAGPVAAFANIGRALRPGGRLVMLVWQAADRNEWAVTLRRAFPLPESPFSLADPAPILTAAGFAGVACTEVEEPVYYGPDADAALGFVRGFAGAGAATEDALTRLRADLAAHLTGDGVWLGARAWLVTASRA
ncbi:class I SAM-dependent methyltransferase [Dactylosporangium sp. McL0621]|uniref:class I SAM-dependent methyltransferase n=1 Tax=Dactylosporangium sp. McL0621 TaxID=3415678 RepID=UPI003CE8C862